jgi:hypothetical protein
MFRRPPAAAAEELTISDTDDVQVERTEEGWVRRTFLRGLNAIFMDSYDGKAIGLGGGRGFNPRVARYLRVRRSLGYALTYAKRAGLADMGPAGELASSGYCLAADANAPEYLVFDVAQELGEQKAMMGVAPPVGASARAGRLRRSLRWAVPPAARVPRRRQSAPSASHAPTPGAPW